MYKMIILLAFTVPLFVAFTPAESITDDKVVMDCNGVAGSCVTSFVSFGQVTTMTIFEQSTGNLVYTGNALNCIKDDNLFFTTGDYDVFLTSNVNATVDYMWYFCGGSSVADATANVPGTSVPLFVGTINVI